MKISYKTSIFSAGAGTGKKLMASFAVMALLTSSSLTASAADVDKLVDTNILAQEIALSAAAQAHVKFGSWTWESMGMQKFSSSTGGHGDYAVNHINTLRAIKSGEYKLAKYAPDTTDGSSGYFTFKDLALLAVSNAFSRTVFYEVPPQYKASYKAYGGAYSNAGRPAYPFNYHAATFQKNPNDNPDGTVTVGGVMLNASDSQHVQYNYTYALAQPEFKGLVFVTSPSIKDAEGKPIPLDVHDLAKLFLKQQAVQLAGQIRNYWTLTPGQTSIDWTVQPQQTSCKSIGGERATARVLTEMLRTKAIKQITQEDDAAVFAFIRNFVIPCYLEKAPGSAYLAAWEKPLTTLPPVAADSGLSYTSAWGQALLVPALYEVASHLSAIQPEQSAQLMKIVEYKARWVNEVISQKQAKNGTPVMPSVITFKNFSDLADADGTPAKSLLPALQAGKIGLSYDVYSDPVQNGYPAVYTPWAYTALRIAERFGVEGAKQNADKILAAAKQCLQQKTGDLCGWDTERPLMGFIVEADGGSQLVVGETTVADNN